MPWGSFSGDSYSKKKTMAQDGTGDRDLLVYLLIYSNKLVYLQLTTVLVYGSNPMLLKLLTKTMKKKCE